MGEILAMTFRGYADDLTYTSYDGTIKEVAVCETQERGGDAATAILSSYSEGGSHEWLDSLKGKMLRIEVYAEDAERPYAFADAGGAEDEDSFDPNVFPYWSPGTFCGYATTNMAVGGTAEMNKS